jgi:hypothetical protein
MMRNIALVALIALVVAQSPAARAPQSAGDAGKPLDWTHFVRIGAYGLGRHSATEIVRDAEASGVYGIEVDNDIPGRYESFLDPTEKLAAIHEVAEAAHHAGNKAFVYIAGTECITANAAKSVHSMAKDHPDWIQRKITGESAIFGGGEAFWIREGDEDVWITPLAPEWRKTYMQRVRQIAATGIDGIYVDIPYWMTHFTGWEDTWASFDDYTVAAFRAQTGLDAKHDLKLGDFHDANFRRWVEFRIATLTDFVRDIRTNAQSVNPEIKVIPEIYPGSEEESVRVGADVYQMYAVVDAIAHEYEFGDGEHMASNRTQLEWLEYQVGMLSFRAFGEGRATWMLNYSWDGDKGVGPVEEMKNLAMSHIVVGANFWDAKGHEMANSNDPATRKLIFAWMKKYSDHIYGNREPIDPVGVYFSPASRDFDVQDFLPSYRGAILLLARAHREFEIVTPRTLAAFHGKSLVLPNASVLDDDEKAALSKYAASGGRLIITGANVLGAIDGSSAAQFPSCPGREFLDALAKDIHASPNENARAFLEAASATNVPSTGVAIEAPPLVVTYAASLHGRYHFYFDNFEGLVPHSVAIPTPQSSLRITVPAAAGEVLHLASFLGPETEIRATKSGASNVFVILQLDRGAVAWLDSSR